MVAAEAPKNDLRERTKTFALRVVSMYSALPKTVEAQILGKQVLAFRARSKPEFISKCGDGLKEVEETAYWLELLVEGDLVVAEKLASLRQECYELTAIFVSIIKSSRRHATTS